MSRAVVLAVLLVAPPARAGEVVRYTIAIGVNAAPEGADLAHLRYADDDAIRFHRLFRSFARRGHLLTLLDAESQRQHPDLSKTALPPTRANLGRVLSELAAAMAADRARGHEVVLVWTYSGHGVIGEDAEAGLTLLDGRLSRGELRARLEALPADYIHLFVDACHAAALVGMRGDPFARELESEAVRFDLAAESLAERLPGLGVITAATADGEAYEWARYRSGVFSHELFSGLLGPADVNGDLRIEYSELHAFIAAANRDVSDPRAVPHVVVHPPRRNHNVAILDIRDLRDAVLLTGNPSALGRFHIEIASTGRYVDANLGEAERAVIALPRGEPAYLRTDCHEALIPPGGATFEELELAERTATGRGTLDDVYRRELFASPFGLTYYKGFVDRTGAISVNFEPLPAPAVGLGASATRRPLAATAWVLSGGLLLATAVTGALALDARADFNNTAIERRAHEANQRYLDLSRAALVTGVVAAVLAVTGWLLWPGDDRSAVPAGGAAPAGLRW